ncbi:DUF397 domain-containing protein [Streptomyces sp. NPDC006711]|uniref:DUF397 domain-containing protein n=1 Tax=Streptomyces sp. NPDC006711 TaxID=3364762 RepID=UPI0036D14775
MSNNLRWFKSSYSSSSGGECLETAITWRKSSYSDDSGGQCVEVALPWQTSSYSSDSGGNCVEVAPCAQAVHIRDSKATDGPSLAVAPGVWTAFLGWKAAAPAR